MNIRNIFIFLVLLFLIQINLYAATDEERILEKQRLMEMRNQLEDERRMMERIQEQIAKEAEKLEKIRLEEEKEAGEEEEMVFVKDIEVEKSKKVSKKKVKKIIKEFKNKNLIKTDIENIQTRLQNLSLEKGYVTTRVYIDFSKIDEGILRYVYSEGILEKIVFADGNKHSLEKFTAFPFTKNRILNIRRIEQGMEQMNRLASNNVTMYIKTGETDSGTIIEIQNYKSKKNSLNIGVDNSGTKGAEYRYSFGLENDNILRLNDSFYLNYSAGIEDKEIYNRNLYMSLGIPFGYWRVNSSFSKSNYMNTIEGFAGKIESKGGTDDLRIGVERILMRGQFFKTNIGAGINKKETKSYLNGSKLDVGSRVLVPMEIYLDNTFYMKQGSIFIKFNYIESLDRFGARKDEAGIQDGDPKAQYKKLGFNGYMSRRFSVFKFPINYLISARGQYSYDDLFGSEQFSPSNRALKDGSISAETGYSISNDLKTSLINILPFFKNQLINKILNSMTIGVFYDIGFIYPKTYGDKARFEGYGLTLGGYIVEYVSFSCSYGNTMKVPDDLEHEKNVVNASINVSIPLF
ncbi:MAG: hypothetical protein LBF97_05135 [Elusimicrobiota bacterium]|nr:hypothetical protein [Elusimicrobiota bacterium]